MHMTARSQLLRILFALSPVMAGAAANESANAVTDLVTSLARVRSATNPTFSPDGQHIAFISNVTGIPQVWIVPSEGGYPRLVTDGDDPVVDVKWSPVDESQIAVSFAPAGGMNKQIYIIHSDGTTRRRLTAGGQDNNILTGWSRDGGRLLMTSNVRSPAGLMPYIVDPRNGDAQELQHGSGVSSLYGVSPDGRAALVWREVSRSDCNLYLVDIATHRETPLTIHSGPGHFVGKFGGDSHTIYLSTDKDRDLRAFARMTVDQNGVVGTVSMLAERADADLSDFEVNAQGTQAALVWNKGGRNELEIIGLPGGKHLSIPDIPTELVQGVAFSPDGRYLAMSLSGPQSPPDLWVLNIAQGGLHQITFSPHAGVQLSRLVRPTLVNFKAEDGLTLSGWLYRPTGGEGRLPYVISFHGGPESQATPAFRSDYQALLSQGIGVFAPNVRGSGGFGKRFENLDNGALRLNAIKDIRACATYLVSSGLADSNRIGITGVSYGGYMTLAGITAYPTLFAAAVDLYGIVNFATFFAHTEPWMAAISTVKYGDPIRDAELLDSLSPFSKLDQIRTPLMVQQGAHDTNVPVIEAEQVVNSLRKRGTPVEYILFPDEGHGFLKQANQIRSTVSLVEFFLEHLSPSAVTR
jgi:dipeptidyl aminopeptidase/acylaminoacyl peptidase